MFGLSRIGRRLSLKMAFVGALWDQFVMGTLRSINFWIISIPRRTFRSSTYARLSKTRAAQAFTKAMGYAYRSTMVEPIRWFIQIAGAVHSWAKSRAWLPAMAWLLPTMGLLAFTVAVWSGDRIDRVLLIQRYFAVSEESFDNFDAALTRISNGDQDSRTPAAVLEKKSPVASAVSEQKETEARFHEMLFRRIYLLEPSERVRLIIGHTLLRRGAISEARSMLGKIAPDDRIGDVRAHSMIAGIYMEQLRTNPDSQLIPLFQHHAQAGALWESAPIAILEASGELLMKAGQVERALNIFQIAALREPSLYRLFASRAQEADQLALASFVRTMGIDHFRKHLANQPTDHQAKILLIELLSMDQEGIEQAEELLKDFAPLAKPGTVYARAASEVCRMRYNYFGRHNPDRKAGLAILDRAMGLDPTNPHVAQEIAQVVQDDANNPAASEEQSLGAIMNRVLASGKATTGTHAILAEYYWSNDQRDKALMHLEQVFRIAPTAVKYANMLTLAYGSMGRLDNAREVANHSLSLLEQRKSLHESFVDDLADSLGKVYQKQENLPDAIRLYSVTLQLNPFRGQTRQRLVKLLRETGDQQRATAEEDAGKLLEQETQQNQRFNTWLSELTRVSTPATSAESRTPHSPAVSSGYSKPVSSGSPPDES
ncbi:MAG: hypothetical protein KF752_08520 [Pirellulaceae bacterium]|nr:hypothetical protein [Pirellulaceae bacterium]